MGVGGANTGDMRDPAVNGDTFMINMNRGGGRNARVEVNANGQAVPELGESLEPSADAKTWVVKLRKCIEFHSGKTFYADDAIA